jgi:hypothetical protein
MTDLADLLAAGVTASLRGLSPEVFADTYTFGGASDADGRAAVDDWITAELASRLSGDRFEDSLAVSDALGRLLARVAQGLRSAAVLPSPDVLVIVLPDTQEVDDAVECSRRANPPELLAAVDEWFALFALGY